MLNNAWWRADYDPDPRYLAHWLAQPLETAAVQSEFLGEQLPSISRDYAAVRIAQPPTAEKALAAFEQLLDEFDTQTTLAQYVRDLDAQLSQLRPGGNWWESERKAVEQLRLLIVRMRRRFL